MTKRKQTAQDAIKGRTDRTPTKVSWCQMRWRCTNPRHHAWSLYGGRGISVCARWNDFRNFVADMGERPAGCSLDRIDNGGNYEPGNCRWATASEQRANMRVTNAVRVSCAIMRRAVGRPRREALLMLCSWCPDAERETLRALSLGFSVTHGACEDCAASWGTDSAEAA